MNKAFYYILLAVGIQFIFVLPTAISNHILTDTDSLPTFFENLPEPEIEKAELIVDLDSLLAQKLTPNEHPGIFILSLKNGEDIHLSVKVSVRGKFRRQRCVFPPIRLNFRKTELEAKGFSKRPDDYKLVTHCLNNEDGHQLVLKEYIAYKLYGMLTDKSFRVKKFPIIYKDSNSDTEISSIAFLLEASRELADRFNGEMCDCLNPQSDEIEPKLFEQMALFQYMIGNLDMDHRMLKNMKLIKLHEGGKMIPVAFDFDFAPLCTLLTFILKSRIREKYPDCTWVLKKTKAI